jgi:Tfp pilus assembly protein PilN
MPTFYKNWTSSLFGHKSYLFASQDCSFTLLYFTLLPYQPTMTTEQNPTQQRQQPLSLSDALSSLSAAGNLALPVFRMPNSMRDRKEQRVFLKSVIDQAMSLIRTIPLGT